MASARGTINLIISATTRGLGAASAEAEAAARRVADAEDRVSAARTQSAAAEERVGAAEARLTAARAQQDAALSRIGVAETNLERVRTSSVSSATRLSQAESELDRLRANGGSASEIEAAENRVNEVRTQSDLAARHLQQAEAQLESARANGERSIARVQAAEAALNNARSNNIRASEAAARAENDLNNLRRRGNQDVDRQRDGILGLFDAFSRLGNAVTGADDAANKFLSTGSALQNVFAQIGGPIIQAVVGIVQFVAVMGAAIEIVGILGGLIGQVLAGAPAILLALAAAAGTVVLGMDGIKKAAEVLQPAFAKLKASVSDVFERALTPAFKQLAAIIPELTSGFDDVALSISIVAQQAIGFLTSAKGVDALNTALAGTVNFVQALAPGITKFLAGLVNAAAAAQPAMQALGTAIGDIFGKVGDVFTKLAGNGVIQAAVAGLASTIEGLANVLAPVVSLLIQMGAALGDSVGQALTSVGAGIEQVTPFFVELARVAGEVLVDAFKQLGPPISELVDSILPGATSGLDGFASLMHNVVLPAVAGFINWIRTDGIPGFIAFTQAVIINSTSAASAILGFVSSALGALEELIKFTAVFTNNPALLKLAGDIEVAKGKVDGLKTSVDALHDKEVVIAAKTNGSDQVALLGKTIGLLADKSVTTISHVLGLPENQALKAAIDTVYSKAVASVSTVTGKIENDALKGSIDSVYSKTVESHSNVFGEQENKNLRAAIDNVINKTVSVVANVSGQSAVQGLISLIDQVHSVTATVTTYIRTITQAFASGGQAPGGVPILVGEQGPELITLPSSGGFVFTAAQTRAMAAQSRATPHGSNGSAPSGSGGDAPITVNVMISQDQIAGIAQVEIQRRDRSTKRTVLAGSGATF